MRTANAIRRDNTTFVILSFEGPDRYSYVGKLAERVTNLSETLARMGFETHLIYLGAPDAPGHEIAGHGRLHLHRWCQWISKYHPEGVYQAEEEKLWDFNGSAPSFVVREIAKRSALRGKYVVVLGEEWHTAEAICRIADIVRMESLEESVLTLWNANDVRSFDRIDWPRLARSACITTVSKYMKHVMWNLGVNALVIPNGIPRRLLAKTAHDRKVSLIRNALEDRLLLLKIADWHSIHRWHAAIQAIARLKSLGRRAVLVAGGDCSDGDSQAYQREVLDAARSLHLRVEDVELSGTDLDLHIAAVLAASEADVVRITSPISEEFARLLYLAADGVLADRDHEPFGQQALEVMAAGGIVFTGCTGEDYADPLGNAIVLETDDPDEIVDYALYLDERKGERDRIRLAGRLTAQRHTWEETVENLVGKTEYLLRSRAGKENLIAQVPSSQSKIPVPASTSAICRLYLQGSATRITQRAS